MASSDIIKIGFDYRSSLAQFEKDTNGVFDGISFKAGKQKITIQLDAKDDKVIDKIKELQKLKLDKFTFEFGDSGLKEQLQTFDKLENKINEIINLGKGKPIIDSSSIVKDINKVEDAVSNMNKSFNSTNVNGLKIQQEQINKNVDSLKKLLDLLYDMKNVNKSSYSGKHNTDWMGIYSSQEDAIKSDLSEKQNKLHSSLNLILSEDKNAISSLEAEANKLKVSLQSVQDLSNRISSNSSISNLGKNADGSFDYKSYANEYKLIDDRLGELNKEYELTNDQLEEYITLQVKADKIMEKVMNHSGGVKGSGAKNKSELRTWIEKSFAEDLNIDPNEIYNGLFGNITDAMYSSWNGISLFNADGTKKNLRDISAEISKYKSVLSGMSDSHGAEEDSQRLREINDILRYIKKNANDIQTTDFSQQIKQLTEEVDYYNKKISEGTSDDFYVKSLETAKNELNDLLSLQDRLNIAKNENNVQTNNQDKIVDNLKEQESQAISTAEAEKKLAEVKKETTSFNSTSDNSQIEELKTDIAEVKTEFGDVKDRISSIESNGFENVREDVEKTKESVKELNSELTEMKSNLSSTASAESNISSVRKDAFPDKDVSTSVESVTNSIKEENNVLEQNTQKVKENTQAKEQNANIDFSKYDKRLDSYNGKIDKYKTTIDRFNDGGWTSDAYLKNVQAVKNAVDEYETLLKELKGKDASLVTSEDISKLDNYEKKIKDTIATVTNMSAAEKGYNFVSGQKELDKIHKLLNENSKMSSEAKAKIKAYYKEIESGNPSMSLDRIHGEIMKIYNAEVEAGRAGRSFFDTLKNSGFHQIAAQMAGMVGVYDVINLGKEGFNVVRELNTALTEMRKVSNETVQSLKNYQATTFDTADAVGTTAKQIQNSTADWMRLGESMDQAAESAKDANVLLNVSEFEGIDEATESLVSMSQAYKDLDKMDIIDVLNNIGNNYSISTDGLATALKDSASALVTANNDLNEAVSLTTAGNAITQDPSKVGAGLRTISLRLVGTEEAKQELSDLGEETDGMITTVSKLRDTIMDATKAASSDGKGFDILDSNGNYKSTYEIMQGLADLYDNIVKKDKELGTNNLNLLLETIAGKNRSNIAASILQNGDMLRSVYEDAQNSEGSAEKELNSYLDSIDGKMAQLENRAQEFWFKVIDSETIKNGIDLLSTLLKGVTDFVDTVGLLPTILTGVGAALSFKNVGRDKMYSLSF